MIAMDRLTFGVSFPCQIFILCLCIFTVFANEEGPETRLLRHALSQATHTHNYHLQVRFEGKWSYVVYDKDWVVNENPLHVLCVKEGYGKGATYAISEKPGEVEYHPLCDGHEERLADCHTDVLRAKKSEHHVGVQCFGGKLHGTYIKEKGKKRKIEL